MEAASYKSFVHLTPDSSAQHIYMNHPLKRWLHFLSVSLFSRMKMANILHLSVNQDPGRFVKYFGALLLIFEA